MKKKVWNKYEKALYNIGDCYVACDGKDLMWCEDYMDDWATLKELVDKQKELEKLEEENAKYKALEQELGIDLVKLFNAKNVYYRIKYVDTNEYSEIEKAHRFLINTLNREIRVFDSDYDEYGFGLPLKDYGKTWWLEKPVLRDWKYTGETD